MTTTLFDDRGEVAEELRAHARGSDPDTSHEAAATVTNLRTSQRRILELLERFGPASDEDLQVYWRQLQDYEDWPPISPSGLRSRRAELVTKGLVYDTGKRGVTSSGRKTIEWELAGLA